MADAEIERLLDAWPVARLATIAADGRPRLVPVVFARAGGALWSPIDGKDKSGRRLARVGDVARDPRVALLLDHYDADWTRLWWIRIDGRASLHGVDPVAAAALRAKYPQYRDVPLFAEADSAAALIRIAPVRTASWQPHPPAG